MTGKKDHTFEFSGKRISAAASTEALYHWERVDHWIERRDKALETVKGTIGAKVTEHPVTGGVQAQIVVDYGDPDAWREYQLAYGKVQSHRDAADAYETDARLYGTQQARLYELDGADVHYFRLGGQQREE